MSSLELMLIAVIWVVLGLTVAITAAIKGRPFWPWLLYAVAFWPPAALHLFFRRAPLPHSGPLDEDQI